MSDAFVHPTALVEPGVVLGAGTRVWDSCHLRAPSRIGRDCIIGEKTYVAYGVEIGDRVKVNAFVYICTAVTIERGVMISAGTVFTNDRFPRATTPDLAALASSEPDEKTLATVVREGATLGARCVIGPGLEIGRFAMVGMGAVVTRNVPAFHLVVGHPARAIGLVCRCGEPFARFREGEPPAELDAACACGRRYQLRAGGVRELAEAIA
jgi:acetyltransferase-like isoleucine patch superfamily enzyme